MEYDNKFIRDLLSKMEADDLEFKRDQYPLESEKQKAELIKDIICIANTPRAGVGYIVIGVATKNGRPTDIVGCKTHPDPAELQRIVSGLTKPTPRFSYKVVTYDGKELGLIEVPADRNVPVTLRGRYGSLNKGAVYLRKNTECGTAESDDILRIASWAKGLPAETEQSSNSLSGWESLYRQCDAFHPDRAYICVLGANEDVSDDDWRSFASVGWDFVVDFDSGTDASGGFLRAGKELSMTRSLRLTALDDAVPVLGNGSSVWVAAMGLQTRPSTIPASTWRQWNQTKARALMNWATEVARATEPKPATAIVFGGERPFVETVSDILDRAFGGRLVFVLAGDHPEFYGAVKEKLAATVVTIGLAEACAGLREIRKTAQAPTGLELPRLDGGTIVVPPERARWVEEALEVVHLGQGLSSAKPGDELRDFLRGLPVTWYGLNARVDVDRRPVTPELEAHLKKELEARGTRRVVLSHWPGAGGSTLGRRVAWDFHTEFPSVLVRTMRSLETSERLQYLFSLTKLPILAVAEASVASAQDLDRVYDETRSSNVPVVFVRIERRFGSTSPSGRYNLEAMLSTSEAVALANKLAKEVPSQAQSLEALVDQQDRRKRTPFYFGLVAFDKDFKGLEPYVSTRLDRAEEPVLSMCRMLALCYHFGQRAMPAQVFAPLLNLSSTKLITMSRVMPPELLELFTELPDRTVRPSHELIAQEILEQILSRGHGDRRNWRSGLADTAIDLARMCARFSTASDGAIADLLHAVMIERTVEDTPAGPWEGPFSPLITAIPTDEGKGRVFEVLTSLFPEEPHFWAHLGRFCSRVLRDHEKAHAAHTRGVKLAQADPVLHHMAGMAWVAELRDTLGSTDSNTIGENEERIKTLVTEAHTEFLAARERDLRSEYNYISEIQVAERVIGVVATAKGYSEDVPRFLTNQGNQWYRDLMDKAEDLLSQLSLARSGQEASRLHKEVRSRLDLLYGQHSKAIQGWTNLLDRTDVYRPPIRRMIIRAYLSRQHHDWTKLKEREILRVSELARENLREEPDSDQNLRLWLQAVRLSQEVSIDRAAEELGYRRLQRPTIDTLYYLYILKFLQSRAGVLAMAKEAQELIVECSRLARDMPHRTRSFEWLGKEDGWKALVHVSSLGDWDQTKDFWSHEEILRREKGRISQIAGPAAGEIELHTGLHAFFVPSRGKLQGGFIRGQDVGRQVEFYLGFSYDGLRAWEVSPASE